MTCPRSRRDRDGCCDGCEELTTLAHELRTPITVLVGFLELAQSQGLNPEHLLLMRTEAQRLKTLVENVFLMSATQTQDYPLALEQVSVSELVRGISLSLLLEAQQHNVTVLLDGDLKNNDVYLEIESFKIILTNLVTNAIRYSYSPGGGTIVIRWKHEGDCLRVSVSDNGIGIAPENQKRIFSRFWREPRARKLNPSGAGIGLHNSSALANRLQGRIEVTSQIDRGSTFDVVLPWLSDRKSAVSFYNDKKVIFP